MKIIFLFASVLFSLNLYSQSSEKFSYSYFTMDRIYAIGLPAKIQKNKSKSKIIIDYQKKLITLECINLKEKYDTTYTDRNLIFFRFRDQAQLVITDDKKRANYNAGDFVIDFFPLKQL